MDKRRPDPITLILAGLLLPLLFVMVFYGKYILHPNDYMFGNSGDGLKNYYTYAYHIKESSPLDFHGMNYPYGETFFYTDCHPLLTLVLQPIVKVFPVVADYSIGILNFLMLFNFIIASFILYLIFLHFRVDFRYSALSALGLMMLWPQVFRLTGHYALSYSLFLPLTYYLLLRFIRELRWAPWGIALLLNNLLWFMVHAYLGMMASAMVFVWFVFYLCIYSEQRKRSRLGKMALSWLATSLLPALLFFLFVKAVDTHSGRTTNPYGFLVYRAELETLFIPVFGWIREMLKPLLRPVDQLWEGWSYLGLASIAAMLVYCLQTSHQWIKGKMTLQSPYLPDKTMAPLLLTALFFLLFSMGLPFRLGMEKLLDYFSIIKNFRGIGRFAWITFMATGIASVVFAWYLGNRLMKKGKKVIAWIVLCLPVLYILESLPQHRLMRLVDMNKSANLFQASQLPAGYRKVLDKIDASKFQAILPLPFFHLGSENYSRPGSPQSWEASMLLSYHTKLPMLGSYLTRTSIMESRNILEVFSPSLPGKTIEEQIRDRRPFLIVYTKEMLTDNENALIWKAVKIAESDNLMLLELDFNKLFENNAKAVISEFESAKDDFFKRDSFYLSGPADFLYFNDYDSLPSKRVMQGKGAFEGRRRGYEVLAHFDPGKFSKGKSYTLSFWISNKGKNYGQDVLRTLHIFVQTKDPTDQVNWVADGRPSDSEILGREWSLFSLDFTVDDPGLIYDVLIQDGEQLDIPPFYVDNLMIREKGKSVYRIISQTDKGIQALSLNNLIFSLPAN